MEWSRLKFIIILLLVCLNLVLGANLLYGNYAKTRITSGERDGITSLLKQNGIILEKNALPGHNRLLSLSEFPNDEELNEAIVKTLIGNAEKHLLGGGLTEYVGSGGYVLFRSGCVLKIEINTGAAVPESARAAERAAGDILRSTGLSVPSGEKNARPGKVEYSQRQSGLAVYGASLEISFEEGKTTIEGCLLRGRPVEKDGGTKPLISLLASFISEKEQLASTGEIVIRKVSYAYHHSVKNGISALIPACVLDTNDGKIIIDASTGRIIEIIH